MIAGVQNKPAVFVGLIIPSRRHNDLSGTIKKGGDQTNKQG